jgi:hypothetical protein
MFFYLRGRALTKFSRKLVGFGNVLVLNAFVRDVIFI